MHWLVLALMVQATMQVKSGATIQLVWDILADNVTSPTTPVNVRISSVATPAPGFRQPKPPGLDYMQYSIDGGIWTRVPQIPVIGEGKNSVSFSAGPVGTHNVRVQLCAKVNVCGHESVAVLYSVV